MQHPARIHSALLAAALAATAGGCGSPNGPPRPPVTFALRTIGEQRLPAVVSNTTGGRLIEVVGGELTFESLARRGGVMAWTEVRITDPGRTAGVERHETPGTYVRRGNTLDVRYATGARETFAVEGNEATLRTVGATCAPVPAGAACLDILRVYRYERLAASAEP